MNDSTPTERLNRRQFLESLGLFAAAASISTNEFTARELAENLPAPSITTNAALPVPPLASIVLNKMAYGIKPGVFDTSLFDSFPGATDSERLTHFIDWQLSPELIDDSICETRLGLAGLTTLNKSLQQLWADHHESTSGSRTLPLRDVITATFIRSVYSQRQLFEIMTAFWHNHFSVYAWDYEYASSTWVQYDRDVIRANALGNFRQFLQAVATSPSMLYYLNNNINQSGGPNENWAREVFELHSMGAENYLGTMGQSSVPGFPSSPIGFVDPDIFEATRCFTGWRVNDGDYPVQTSTGEFLYYDPWHDHFQKTVLGQLLPANAAPMADGLRVLDLLAAHPGTARFISRKLCRRFISDDPPESVVEAAAAEFRANLNAPDQIKKVLRVILLSDSFQNTWAEKIKQPFESAISMLRAVNADFIPTNDFLWYYEAMNQPLFERRTPDGYPDVKFAWTNTTSMLKRWQLGINITENNMNGCTCDLLNQMPASVNTANTIVDYWLTRILGRQMYSTTQRSRLVDFMRGPYTASFALNPAYINSLTPRLVGLILMSPDFQLR